MDEFPARHGWSANERLESGRRHSGGHIAALYQWNWVVVGLEGDGEWWGIEGDDGGQAGVTDDVEGNWLASIRGRLGVGIDRILLYGTGGWQWGDVDIEQTAGGASATLGVTFDGWTAGGGVEYAVTDHFIAGIEYRFTDFDRESVGATAVAVAGGYDVEDFHAIRGRVAWKW